MIAHPTAVIVLLGLMISVRFSQSCPMNRLDPTNELHEVNVPLNGVLKEEPIIRGRRAVPVSVLAISKKEVIVVPFALKAKNTKIVKKVFG